MPATVERTRLLPGGISVRGAVPRKLANLPSFLPGEQTFVSQSQKVALSSTVLDGCGPSYNSNTPTVGRRSSKSSNTPNSTRDRRKSSRRSNVTKEDLLSFILNKDKSPEAVTELQTVDDTEEEDSDKEDWDKLKSVHGSVQKYLNKPDPRQSIVISGNVKSRTRACLSAPKSQQRRKVVKNLSDDLRRKSLVNQTIEEVTEDSSNTEESSIKKTSANNIDPKLLVQSYQNFSTDSAKALIAQIEGGGYTSDKSDGVRTSSQSSCDSDGSQNDKPEQRKSKMLQEKTSLTPVPMDVVTPAVSNVRSTEPVLSSPTITIQTVSSPSLRPPPSPIITQKPPILDGANIFVDFRTGHENLGKVLEKKATELGAKISEKLTADVTHVIFKDGSLGKFLPFVFT